MSFGNLCRFRCRMAYPPTGSIADRRACVQPSTYVDLAKRGYCDRLSLDNDIREMHMSTATNHASENEVTILARILANENGQLPKNLARYILNLTISERDKARMHELAVRNQDDALTPAEKEELFGFAKATSLLSILKSKARRTLGIKLKRRTVS